jgi:hypothetical protein
MRFFNYGHRIRFARRPIDKDTTFHESLHHPDAPSYDAEQTEGGCSERWALSPAAAASPVLLAMRTPGRQATFCTRNDVGSVWLDHWRTTVGMMQADAVN